MTTAPRRGASDPAARLILAAFAVALLADLGSLLADAQTGHRIAKPLLMPLLAAYTAVRGGPRPLVAALLFGWGGDVFLLAEAEWAFLVGMGSFALGHVCYLVLFGRDRCPRAAAPGYGLALVVVVALLWPDLPADLQVPVAAYAVLLTAMAWRSSALGWLAGAGGALFLVSDLLIAAEVARWPQPPVPNFWIMLLYSAGQALLVLGVLAHHARDRATARG
ncbi:lysoplasmalogenase [Streptomyces sp. NPDC057638]|uniref:lysoplasmalogenase n=1 Tax=Streptomyces sp. NPDC057638 TaxID=3346190 RepID=UPI0036AF396D